LTVSPAGGIWRRLRRRLSVHSNLAGRPQIEAGSFFARQIALPAERRSTAGPGEAARSTAMKDSSDGPLASSFRAWLSSRFKVCISLVTTALNTADFIPGCATLGRRTLAFSAPGLPSEIRRRESIKYRVSRASRADFEVADPWREKSHYRRRRWCRRCPTRRCL
jgi:hypothetical protein